MDEGKGNGAAAATLGAPRGLVRHPHVERPSPQLRVGSGPSAAPAGRPPPASARPSPRWPCLATSPSAGSSRAHPAPRGAVPPTPPHAAGCLLPAATPPLPRPQLSWRFEFPPVLSLLSLLTPGGGRTVTAPGGVPGSPLAATLRGKCLSGIGEYPSHRRFKPTQLDPQKPLSWVWSRT